MKTATRPLKNGVPRVAGILPARAAAVSAAGTPEIHPYGEGKMPSQRAGETPATLFQRAPRPAPVSLRISVTDRCSLRCFYCVPPAGPVRDPQADVRKRPRAEILRFEEIAAFVRVLRGRLGLSKVHLTGGEPLLRRGLVDLVAMLAGEGPGDLALTTSGQGLGPLAGPLRRAGLARVNVSLDTLRPQRFRQASGGELARTLEGLDAALEAGLRPVKINMVVARGFNLDEVAEVAEFGLRRGCQVRFLELMPLGPAAARFQEWFVPSEEVLARLGEAFDLRPLAPPRTNQTSRSYRAVRRAGGAGFQPATSPPLAQVENLCYQGVIGVISSCTTPFCAGCRRLRLTATGELIGCLARGEGPLIRPLLGDEPALMAAVRRALAIKRSRPHFSSKKVMSAVGG